MATEGLILLIVGAGLVAIAIAVGKLTKAGRKLNDPKYHREQERRKATEYSWDYTRRMMTEEADVMLPMFIGVVGGLSVLFGLGLIVLSLLRS